MSSSKNSCKKVGFGISIVLRVVTVGASVASAWLMFTNHQNALVFGVPMVAKYSYVNSFKFMAYANAVAGGLSLLNSCVSVIVSAKRMTPNRYFILFLLDLVALTMVMAGSAAATTEGYLGRHGNSHAGWMPICGYFGRFCSRVTLSLALSYVAFLLFLALTIISAFLSR